jgi:uncharacterized protein YggU (UPF0235/DUF167 family)
LSILEILLIFELVLLVAAGFFWGVSLIVSPKDPDDPLAVFWRTFWKVFLRRRTKFKVALANLHHEKARQYEKMKQHGDLDGIKELMREELDEHEVDDNELAKLLEADAEERAALAGPSMHDSQTTPAMRTRVSRLNVKVVPFGERDELVSIDKDGATIGVVNGPEDGRSNKAVIELIAKHFHIKAYQISLIKGHYRARKLVQIAGLDQSELDAKASTIS